MTDKVKKIAIVFDMDETLGYFTQLGFVIEQYEDFTKKVVTIEEAIDILNCYPNIFRPGILHTFNYLRNQNCLSLVHHVLDKNYYVTFFPVVSISQLPQVQQKVINDINVGCYAN